MRRFLLASVALAAFYVPAEAQFSSVPACPATTAFQGVGAGASAAVDPAGNVCASLPAGAVSAKAAPLFVIATAGDCPAGVPAAQCVVSPYTWTAPAKYSAVEIWAWGTGGPGGGGAQQTAATACSGGGAGGAGGKFYGLFSPVQVGASLTVTAPLGPQGGPGAASPSAQGGITSTASNPQTTVVAATGYTLVSTGRGGAGSGGNLAAQSYGGGGGLPSYQATDATQSTAGTNVMPNLGGIGGSGATASATIAFGVGSGGSGGAATGTSPANANYTAAAPGGGAAGGGINASGVAQIGTGAPQVEGMAFTQSAAGAVCGAAGAGSTPGWTGGNWQKNRAINAFSGGGGGGAGGCTTGVGGQGGAGGTPGGGGGGGGCAQNGANGGQGGAGGDAMVILIVDY